MTAESSSKGENIMGEKYVDYNTPEGIAALLSKAFDQLADDPAWLNIDEDHRKRLLALTDPAVVAKRLQEMEDERRFPGRVTSLTIHWYNQGIAAADMPAHEKLIVKRNPPMIQWSQYDGTRSLIKSQTCKITRQECRHFFSIIDKEFGRYPHFEEYNQMDYRVDVCDGSEWKLVIRYAKYPVKNIRGNVKLPPYGHQITAALKELLSTHECDIEPVFFGIE